MRLRPDFRAAVSLENRLHRESGEEIAEPISPAQFWTLPQAIPGGTRPKVGGAHYIFYEVTSSFFCCSCFRSQSMAIHCNRREV